MKKTVLNKQVDAVALMFIKNHVGNVNRWKSKIRSKLKFNDPHIVNVLAEKDLYANFGKQIKMRNQELLKHQFEPYGSTREYEEYIHEPRTADAHDVNVKQYYYRRNLFYDTLYSELVAEMYMYDE